MNRLSRIKQTSTSEDDLDLLSFFAENEEIQKLSCYDYDKIYITIDDKEELTDLSFSTKREFSNEIKRISSIYSKNIDSFAEFNINSYNIHVRTLLPPLVQNNGFMEFSRLNENQQKKSKVIISDEHSEILASAINEKKNIFIINSIDSNIENLYEDFSLNIPQNDLIISNFSVGSHKKTIAFNENSLNTILKLNPDYAFCKNINSKNLKDIFENILKGKNGFIVSLNLKININPLNAIKNLLLLDYTNLTDENAEFLVTSAVDLVVLVEDNYIKEISASFTNDNKETTMNTVSIENKETEDKKDTIEQIPKPKSKLSLLKEKLKQRKLAKQSKTEANDESIISRSEQIIPEDEFVSDFNDLEKSYSNNKLFFEPEIIENRNNIPENTTEIGNTDTIVSEEDENILYDTEKAINNSFEAFSNVIQPRQNIFESNDEDTELNNNLNHVNTNLINNDENENSSNNIFNDDFEIPNFVEPKVERDTLISDVNLNADKMLALTDDFIPQENTKTENEPELFAELEEQQDPTIEYEGYQQENEEEQNFDFDDSDLIGMQNSTEQENNNNEDNSLDTKIDENSIDAKFKGINGENYFSY